MIREVLFDHLPWAMNIQLGLEDSSGEITEGISN